MEPRFRVRLEELVQDARIPPGSCADLPDALPGFLAPFAATLQRQEQRDNCRLYVQGLLSGLGRKNAEAISYLHGHERQALQKFVGQSPLGPCPLDGGTGPPDRSRPRRGRRRPRLRSFRLPQEGHRVRRRPAPVVRTPGQGGQLPGRRLPRLRLAQGARPGRLPPLPAQGVETQTLLQGRRAARRRLPHPPRAGPGHARLARSAAAARLDRGRRRDGTQLVVPQGVAHTRREVPPGRAVQHAGARPGGIGPAVLGTGTPAGAAVPARGPIGGVPAGVGVADGPGARRGEGSGDGACGASSGAGQGGGQPLGAVGDAGGVPGGAVGRQRQARLPAGARVVGGAAGGGGAGVQGAAPDRGVPGAGQGGGGPGRLPGQDMGRLAPPHDAITVGRVVPDGTDAAEKKAGRRR